jgi:hypothetical protein
MTNRGRGTGGVNAVAAISVLLLVGTASVACSAPAALTCRSDVDLGPVPDWASTGFTPGAGFPHVVGRSGRIVAVLFSYPLVATPDGQPPRNKVLLVSRQVPQRQEPVTIDARLSGTDQTVRRVRNDGPGPGILDLPKQGCWTLTLTWGTQTDSLDLKYQ